MLSMSIPLAERLRPRTLDEYIGQAHLVGQNGVFRKFLETGNVPSFILWGPPGVGKTTLAKIVATTLKRPFYTLSAVTSGVKEVREVLESARKQKFFDSKPPILFIDEIHRFNKSQQDSLLGAVEQGVVTLIGATTENPSFEVISPLLSRCQVYILQPMTDGELQTLLDRALATDPELKTREIEVQETEALFRFSGGDARKLLNILDIITGAADGKVTITNQYVTDCLQQNIALYDKNGEQHYDVISAFIKSVRGSDPNAAIYYLARMLAGGEEPRFIARRLVILASEDIGLANPNALLLANACFDTVHKIGMPEARITLAETTIYLATSPKSNSAYMAINQALSFVEHDTTNRPVPLHLRNAPTKLMDQAGYGKGYKYAHDYGGFAGLEFMPETLKGKKFYEPNTRNAAEAKIAACIRELWKDKYKEQPETQRLPAFLKPTAGQPRKYDRTTSRISPRRTAATQATKIYRQTAKEHSGQSLNHKSRNRDGIYPRKHKDCRHVENRRYIEFPGRGGTPRLPTLALSRTVDLSHRRNHGNAGPPLRGRHSLSADRRHCVHLRRIRPLRTFGRRDHPPAAAARNRYLHHCHPLPAAGRRGRCGNGRDGLRSSCGQYGSLCCRRRRHALPAGRAA